MVKRPPYFYILILSLACISINVFAQSDTNYYQTLAGDSAFAIGHTFKKEKQKQSTVINLNRGYYRIVFDEKINADSLMFQVTTLNGDPVEIKKSDHFIDYENPVKRKLNLEITYNGVYDGDVLAKLFWVYTRNVKKQPPQFAFQDIAGEDLTNETLKGHVVVIDFWGLNCKPCREEVPQLARLSNQYSEYEDVKFLAVSHDSNDDLSTFKENSNFGFQLIGNHNSSILITQFLEKELFVKPAHVVIDKSGHIVFQLYGTHPNITEMLSEAIEQYR